MKVSLQLCVLMLSLYSFAGAQGSAGTAANVEPRYVLDIPTAGMMPKGGLAVDLEFYQEGGILAGLSVGVLERFTVGLSYGGTHLIGSAEPVMNETPGVNIKVRLVEEGDELPAIALGFDSQGREGFDKDLDRYAIKSPGFYAAASRNYELLGSLSLHGGMNFSLERGDDDHDVNVFVGAEKSIGPVLAFVAEYNLALNDSEGKARGRGRGYFNLGLRWSLGSGLTLGLNIKDLLKNGEDLHVGNRTVRLEYVHFF